MSDETIPRHKPTCNNPALNYRLTSYCFGEMTANDRSQFEAHLSGCARCQDEVARLSAAVHALRTDESIAQELSEADLGTVFGISAKVDIPFFGHRKQVLASSALYALSYVLVLFIEIAYGFDRFGKGALVIAPLVFAWVFGTAVAALALDARLMRKGRHQLYWPWLVLWSAAAILYIGLLFFLPNYPIIKVKVTPHTPQVSYLKDIGFLLPISILFLLRPIHFVMAMQRQLALGQHKAALSLLQGDKLAVPPRGIAFPSKKVLVAYMIAAALYVVPGAMRLFDILLPGPYTNLYSGLILLRWLVYFFLAAECLLWYRKAVDELVRESVVATRNR